MEQCKGCEFYDVEYDELRQKWDDVVFPGEEDAQKHYCRMYEKYIDKNIIADKTKCESRVEKNE